MENVCTPKIGFLSLSPDEMYQKLGCCLVNSYQLTRLSTTHQCH